MALQEVQDKIIARLRAVGAKGAKPPFALRRAADKALLDEALHALIEAGAVRQLEPTCYVLAEIEPPPDTRLLKELRRAKTAGRTAKSLGDRLGAAAALVEPALIRLVDAEALVIHWRGMYAYYFLPDFAPPTLEGVADQLAEHLHTHPDQIHDLADLRRLFRRNAAKALVKEAMAWLEAEARARRVEHHRRRRGKLRRKNYWLAARQMSAMMTDGSVVASPSRPSQETLLEVGERIRDAYDILRRQSGLPFVDILDLQQRSQVPLDVLHDWLHEGLQRGAVQATGTNLAAVDPVRQRAAVTWRGHRCLLVELIDS